jgi:PKD repeat protein
MSLVAASAETLTASPMSGTAPLTVKFNATVKTFGARYPIDFGDGTTGSLRTYATSRPCPVGASCVPGTASHTYRRAGTYKAQLSADGSTMETPTITVSPAGR